MQNSAYSPHGKARPIIFMVAVILVWCAIAFRLIEIQVVHGNEYRIIAGKQVNGRIAIKAERGLVFDRKGRQLAVNVIKSAFCAYPSCDVEIAGIYRYLDKIYRRRPGESRGLYALKPEGFRWIDRSLADELAARIVRDSIPGLEVRKDLSREYPFGDVGKQLLGYTDIDGKGISGLEYSYDSVLAGKAGEIDYLRDANRNTYRIRQFPLVKPVAGRSIVLTLDWYFQEIVEEELKAGVEKFGALEGTAIFLDCHTGEILAASDYVAGGKADPVKLKAVSDCFEPGSVFKVFTAATLLDEGKADPDERIFCENGLWVCGRRTLRDDKKHGSLTFREVIEMSSNIGTAKFALRLGGVKLHDAASRFGFGKKCFVGLSGEQSGRIGQPGVWSDYNVAALSIGHAVAVNALQLANGMAAIANGGNLYRPTIIKGILDSNGKLISKTRSELLGRVIKKRSAEILRSFLAGVVERGTAKPAKSDVIRLAGKTGTAQIPDPKGGGYSETKYVASFLGFFPAENPQIAGIVVLQQPQPIHYGGYTAGPTFKNIAEKYAIANLELFRPETKLVAVDGEAELREIPDLRGQQVGIAMKMAEKSGMNIIPNCSTGAIEWQYPPRGRKIPGGENVAVVVQGSDDKTVMLPDFSGMKIRTAMAVLDYAGMDYELAGNGIIVGQIPSAGTILAKGSTCRLVCDSSILAALDKAISDSIAEPQSVSKIGTEDKPAEKIKTAPKSSISKSKGTVTTKSKTISKASGKPTVKAKEKPKAKTKSKTPGKTKSETTRTGKTA